MKKVISSVTPFGKVIGIGASAGGLEPVKALVKQIQKSEAKEDAFLLIIHQSDRFESHLLEILAPDCVLPMKWAEEGASIEAGNFYLCRAQQDVWIEAGKFTLIKGPKSIPGPSIDRMLTSLAKCYQEQSVAIILSGSGYDGANGSCAVAEVGGLVLTQFLNEAQYPQMPEACLRKCPEARAVSVHQLIDEINFHRKQQSSPILNSTIEQIKRHTAQKLKEDWKISLSWIRPSWQERCWSLTQILSDESEVNKMNDSESTLSTMTHNAINFLLEHHDTFIFNQPFYPSIVKWLAEKIQVTNTEHHLRIWVPFAGTGEIAFSLSLSIQALLDQYGIYKHVQIFTSDLSEEKIDIARKGIFERKLIEKQVPEEFHGYFKPNNHDDYWELIQEIKSKIIFSPHNPFSDPPFLHLDLIASGTFFNRLNQEARMRIRDIFALSLKNGGELLIEDPNWLAFSPGPFKNIKESPYLFSLDTHLFQSTIEYKFKSKEKSSWYNELIHQISQQQNQPSNPYASISEKNYVIIDKSFSLLYLSDGLSTLFHLPTGSPNQSIFSYLDEKLETEIKSQISGFENKSIQVTPTFRKLILNDGHTYFIRTRIGFPPVSFSLEEGYIIAFDIIPEKEIIANQKEDYWDEKTEAHEYQSEINALKIRLAKAEEELSYAHNQQHKLQDELKNSHSNMQQIQEQLAGSNEELASSNEELKVAYQELKLIYNELQLKEQKLELAHNRLQDLISNSFQPYLQISNQYIVELFNSKAADIIKACTNTTLETGKSLLHHLKGESLQKFLKYFTTVMNGHVERGEFLIPDLTGRRRHFYFTATPLFNEFNEVEHVLFNFLDFSDLNEIKEELEERNQLIENVFKVVDVGLIVTDAIGTIITCNDAAAGLVDVNKEELIGQPLTEKIVLHQLDSLVFETETNETKKNLFELKLKDSKYKLVQATFRNINLQDGGFLKVISILDITNKIKYLNLLEDTQTAAHVGGWEYNILNKKFEFTEEVKRILPSLNTGNLNLRRLSSFINEKIRLKFKKQIPALLNGLIIIEEDIPLSFDNENDIWLHIVAKPFVVNGHVRKIIGTVQDITDKKISELELKKLSLVASKTHNAVIITNNKQEIEWVNESFEKMTGFTFEEVMGKNPKLLQGKDTDPEAIKRISEKLSKKEPLTETILNYHKNGTPYWIELTITPVLDEQGKVEKFISIESDVTHEKNIEQQQKHLLRELTRQNQELLRFSYITSHNLRAPLANILGLLNLFDRSHLPTQEDKFVLDSLFESANTLNSTLQDLVESLHHKTEGEKAKTILSMQEAWEHVKRLFTNQLVESNAIIDVHFEHCPYLLWNKNYLYSVLQNLLSNSIKYRKLTESLRITISMEIHNHEPVLNFSDNGQGFDAERYQDRLFGLYQRFNSEVEGKGLGLFIVNSQLKSMGGHIEVWSKPGEGAKFTLYLGKNALPPNHSNHQ